MRFFIVLEGDVLVSLEGKKIGKLDRGQSFGEEYVLQPNRPFQHRVDSISNSKVFHSFLGRESIEVMGHESSCICDIMHYRSLYYSVICCQDIFHCSSHS